MRARALPMRVMHFNAPERRRQKDKILRVLSVSEKIRVLRRRPTSLSAALPGGRGAAGGSGRAEQVHRKLRRKGKKMLNIPEYDAAGYLRLPTRLRCLTLE